MKNQNVPCLLFFLAGFAASQLSHTAVYVRKVTTIPYSFQFKGYSMVWLPAGPPTTACTCLLPKRAFLQSQPWEAKHGRSKGRRWRVNVCWHLGSLPLRQSGVWIKTLLCLYCWARKTPLQSWPLPKPSYVFHINLVFTLKYSVKQCMENQFWKWARVRLLYSSVAKQIKSAYPEKICIIIWPSNHWLNSDWRKWVTDKLAVRQAVPETYGVNNKIYVHWWPSASSAFIVARVHSHSSGFFFMPTVLCTYCSFG